MKTNKCNIFLPKNIKIQAFFGAPKKEPKKNLTVLNQFCLHSSNFDWEQLHEFFANDKL